LFAPREFFPEFDRPMERTVHVGGEEFARIGDENPVFIRAVPPDRIEPLEPETDGVHELVAVFARGVRRVLSVALARRQIRIELRRNDPEIRRGRWGELTEQGLANE